MCQTKIHIEHIDLSLHVQDVAKVQISHLSQMYLWLSLTSKHCLVELCCPINEGFQGGGLNSRLSDCKT